MLSQRPWRPECPTTSDYQSSATLPLRRRAWLSLLPHRHSLDYSWVTCSPCRTFCRRALVARRTALGLGVLPENARHRWLVPVGSDFAFLPHSLTRQFLDEQIGFISLQWLTLGGWDDELALGTEPYTRAGYTHLTNEPINEGAHGPLIIEACPKTSYQPVALF